MDSLVERVRQCICEHELLRRGEPVLVGLSGGADSIVLTHVLIALGFPITAVHINYRLRGEKSDGDETFVRDWCSARNVDVRVRSFDTVRIASERGLSTQHAARELRYEEFAAAAADVGAAKVATGHHRDDQAETVLLNLFRGTGIEGLAGMPIKRHLPGSDGVVLVRPLLGITRAEIEDYATAKGLEWREDATNTSPAYRRGALRKEILPVIQKYFGESAPEKVSQAAELVRRYLDASLEADLRHAFEAAAESADGLGALRLEALESMDVVIRRRIIIEAVRRWLPGAEASASMAEEIEALLSSQPGRKYECGAGEVWRERNRLLFQPPHPEVSRNEQVLPEPGARVRLSGGTLEAELLGRPPEELDAGGPNEVFVDARAITFPLHLRPWQEGDSFSPLGMNGTKKLSDFLTDEQVPPHRKHEVYVVLSKSSILWVVGHRIAQTARIRSDTTETIRLTYSPVENRTETSSNSDHSRH